MNAPRPRATYRLQLHEGFPFAAAREVVPYLARLGVSHLYLSPVFAARPGSLHGYDVVDPACLNPRLGGESEFLALAAAARDHGLGILLDIVPNHMAAHVSNPYWIAALTHGEAGPAGRIFDIDWTRGKIRLPILAEPSAAALRGGRIRPVPDPVTRLPALDIAGSAYPLRPESVAALVAEAGFPIGTPAGALPADALADFLAALPQDRIGSLLAAQHYVPVHLRAAADTLTYRRFFTISDLIGVRVEDEPVFDLVHALPLALLRDRVIDGLRVDHIDGLADPAGYAARLRAAAGPAAPIYVEKILGPGEVLRPWPVTGTTGYEHLATITGAMIDRRGYARLAARCRARGWLPSTAAQRLFASKDAVARGALAGETEAIVRLLGKLAAADPAARDFGPATLREGVIALIAGFPVYRAYAATPSAMPGDAALFAQAVSAAARYADPWASAASDWIARVLDAPPPGCRRRAAVLQRRLQQLTGPVMAKGYEDRELFRSVVLGAANEVGGDAARPAVSVAALHAQASRAAARPGLVPLATHDTKGGAATRARLAALSHRPDALLALVDELERLATAWRPAAGPDPADRWMVWQTALAVWPVEADRLTAYAEKCIREAGRHGTWENPQPAYEAAMRAFCRRLLEAPEAAGCRALIAATVDSVGGEAGAHPGLEGLARAGARLGMSQTILQLLFPGTPDIYQGTELPDLTLVDPDNRRPVDFAARRALLAEPPVFDLAVSASQLHATARLLALRARHPGPFGASWQEQAAPAGWVAASREADGHLVFLAVPLTTSGTPEIRLPRALTCVFTGAALRGPARPAPSWPFIVGTADA